MKAAYEDGTNFAAENIDAIHYLEFQVYEPSNLEQRFVFGAGMR